MICFQLHPPGWPESRKSAATERPQRRPGLQGRPQPPRSLAAALGRGRGQCRRPEMVLVLAGQMTRAAIPWLLVSASKRSRWQNRSSSCIRRHKHHIPSLACICIYVDKQLRVVCPDSRWVRAQAAAASGRPGRRWVAHAAALADWAVRTH